METPTNPPSPLDYARGHARFRVRRWMVVTFVVTAIVVAGFAISPMVEVYFYKRSLLIQQAQDYERAKKNVAPRDTVVYQTVVPLAPATQALPANSAAFEAPPPVVYLHECSWWASPRSEAQSKRTRIGLLQVRYWGLIEGRPSFSSTFKYMTAPKDFDEIEMVSGNPEVTDLPTRPLTNLRIYAGRADPVDLTRFTLPFDSDGGRGRFEFKTDDDATDGGKLAPDVWIEWDDVPATNPSPTRPSTNPASTNH